MTKYFTPASFMRRWKALKHIRGTGKMSSFMGPSRFYEETGRYGGNRTTDEFTGSKISLPEVLINNLVEMLMHLA